VAAGFNLDQNCDVGYCEEITISSGAEIQLACRWDFDERHWQRMSFMPVGRGVVTIVGEWFEREVRQDRRGTHETVILWTRLRNPSSQVITVIPTVVVTPSRYGQ
jgi:hypothetical protein